MRYWYWRSQRQLRCSSGVCLSGRRYTVQCLVWSVVDRSVQGPWVRDFNDLLRLIWSRPFLWVTPVPPRLMCDHLRFVLVHLQSPMFGTKTLFCRLFSCAIVIVRLLVLNVLSLYLYVFVCVLSDSFGSVCVHLEPSTLATFAISPSMFVWISLMYVDCGEVSSRDGFYKFHMVVIGWLLGIGYWMCSRNIYLGAEFSC